MDKKLVLLFIFSVILHIVHCEHRFSSRKHKRGKTNTCPFNICEDAPNYPDRSVRKIIEKNHDLHSYFGNVIEPSNPIVLNSRFGGNDFEPFCKTVDKTVLPKSMKDVDNVVRAVANVGPYQQVVKFQTCGQGEPCHAGSLLMRKTTCVQKFHVIKLLTVNVNNDTLEYRDFEVPTTCVCTYLED